MSLPQLRSLVRQSLWSLTPQHVRRTSGPENFQSSAKKDFFNTIGAFRTWAAALTESVDPAKADIPVACQDFRQ